jgi:hypothetical protein
MLAMRRAAVLIGLLLFATAAVARDDGRYANSPLKQWFESLECTNADGYIVSDPDWESDRGKYRVRIDGEWVVVPDGALIRQPNLAGPTIVWKHYLDGHPRVRCFMPGSMT